MRARIIAAGVVLAFVAVACGNSGSSGKAASSTSTSSAASSTAATGTFPAVDQPGVTPTEIRVSGVTSTTNALGGQYGTAFDGVQAYFDMINSQGGMYGRKLVMVKRHDDQMGSNQREVAAIIDQDNVFAVLPVATIVSFNGASLLAQNNVPTYGWGINDQWTGPPNLFGHLGALCNGSACPGILVPWLAKQLGKHRLGVLAYNVQASSDCVDGLKASFAKYGKSADATIAYSDANLSFGVTDLSSDVQKMINAKVDFVTTCMDTNGTLTLAKEMRQQGMTAIQYLPNANDTAFMQKNGGFFQGSIVITQVAPTQTKPRFPALEQYISQMAKLGKPLTENAEIGWVNADQFVTGLKAAGPSFTRQKVIDATNQETSFDANGMLAPLDWTQQHTNLHYPLTCQALLKVNNSKLETTMTPPGKPFICWRGSDSTTSVTAIKPTFRQ